MHKIPRRGGQRLLHPPGRKKGSTTAWDKKLQSNSAPYELRVRRYLNWRGRAELPILFINATRLGQS